VYLDDTLRIARFLPDQSLEDSEADQEAAQREAEPILFVFKRVVEEAAEEEEEVVVEEEEEEEEQVGWGGMHLPGRALALSDLGLVTACAAQQLALLQLAVLKFLHT
jgi:CO dehydrogenase/acetyl-CoA synthase beta subunit